MLIFKTKALAQNQAVRGGYKYKVNGHYRKQVNDCLFEGQKPNQKKLRVIFIIFQQERIKVHYCLMIGVSPHHHNKKNCGESVFLIEGGG